MSSLLYLFTSLRERLPASQAFIAPLLISGVVLATWAWFVALATTVLIAFVFAAGLGAALFGSWFSFAYRTQAVASKANGNLLTQLSQENRANRRSALYDASSGLYNRWYLELRLQEEFLRCQRYGLCMAVVCMKLGNVDLTSMSTDTWGGLSSDLARRVAKTVRAVDITASLGPLEFAISLVHCDRDGAERVISRLLGELQGRPVEVGLAAYPDDDGDGKFLLELARRRAAPWSPSNEAA